MAQPTTRDEIIDYALRRLGEPVIEVNVDRQQCDDRLEEALELFAQRHFDGAERAYFKHKITQTDKDTCGLTLVLLVQLMVILLM